MEKAKVKKIVWMSAAGVLAALIILVTVFCFVRVKDGFNTGEKPFAVQISRNGKYETGFSGNENTRALYGDIAEQKDDYDKVVNAYNSMTKFTAMRGITENRWFPKAKLEAVITDAQEIKSLRAEKTIAEKEDKDGKKAETNGYLIKIDFTGATQEAEIKVKKGTKDKTNVIYLVDEKGDEKAYGAGDKVSFKFNEIVLVIGENRFINDLTLYAFEKTDADGNGLDRAEFVAYKIVVQANRTSLYNECTRLLP